MSNEKNPGSQMRITPLEQSLIRNTFKGNEELLRLMRKVFLPELDPYVPLGQQIDLWMTIPVDQLTPEQIVINLKARNSLIVHIDQMLQQLKALAEMPETKEDLSKKNSAR